MDLHNKPFDEATMAKLDIFEKYASEWLPTFLKQDFSKLSIVDFFSGTGFDIAGHEGSSIRILNVLKKFINHINPQTKIKVYFNEFKNDKYEKLINTCNEYLLNTPALSEVIEIEYSNDDFEICFNRILPKIKNNPSLIFLDQNGIKFLTLDYLQKLENTFKTDFLYFVSSSYFIRFGDSGEFRRYFSFDLEQANKYPYKFIHNILLEQIKQKLPPTTELKLYPFSIKKGANIHGLIFGSKNLKGVEKFLNIAWKLNPINGNANFDIDDDKSKQQTRLFDENWITKIDLFNRNLEIFIKSNSVVTNAMIYVFTLNQGHVPSHATQQLLKLKKDKKVHYDGKGPKINYNAVKNIFDRISVTWIK
jgi:three-Cys-motif partner protein